MTKLQAIEYLNKHSVYTDEWTGAGMWEAVEKLMKSTRTTFTKEYLDRLLKDANDF